MISAFKIVEFISFQPTRLKKKENSESKSIHKGNLKYVSIAIHNKFLKFTGN